MAVLAVHRGNGLGSGTRRRARRTASGLGAAALVAGLGIHVTNIVGAVPN